ncbi:hypothetical protein MFRU_005g00530 [Monilinia fructicola]|nr:hypothetical protein MFRU_005g00530 [Monilinia fructicola]
MTFCARKRSENWAHSATSRGHNPQGRPLPRSRKTCRFPKASSSSRCIGTPPSICSCLPCSSCSARASRRCPRISRICMDGCAAASPCLRCLRGTLWSAAARNTASTLTGSSLSSTRCGRRSCSP